MIRKVEIEKDNLVGLKEFIFDFYSLIRVFIDKLLCFDVFFASKFLLCESAFKMVSFYYFT